MKKFVIKLDGLNEDDAKNCQTITTAILNAAYENKMSSLAVLVGINTALAVISQETGVDMQNAMKNIISSAKYSIRKEKVYTA